MIEAHQLVSMTDLISQVLQQLSASYNNILNNNLNDSLSILTIISVLLAVLAVITGFFGMNVPLPFTEEPNAWIYILMTSLILWVALSQWLKPAGAGNQGCFGRFGQYPHCLEQP